MSELIQEIEERRAKQALSEKKIPSETRIRGHFLQCLGVWHVRITPERKARF